VVAESRISLPKDELWNLLVEAVHALPMYNNHKRYVQEVMLKDKPEISAKELAVQINVPLGEAMVMLNELQSKSSQLGSATEKAKSLGPSLLDFKS
jgi:hypothetical protein